MRIGEERGPKSMTSPYLPTTASAIIHILCALLGGVLVLRSGAEMVKMLN